MAMLSGAGANAIAMTNLSGSNGIPKCHETISTDAAAEDIMAMTKLDKCQSRRPNRAARGKSSRSRSYRHLPKS
jgi:hypothetical protein